MQAKLHRWAAADPGRRFDDLFNFVHDPATLLVAFDRVAGNTGARTAGVDGLTVADVETQLGVPGFLDDLRAMRNAFTSTSTRHRARPGPGSSARARDVLGPVRRPSGEPRLGPGRRVAGGNFTPRLSQIRT
jgi:RNA-directed DNA polymerase